MFVQPHLHSHQSSLREYLLSELLLASLYLCVFYGRRPLSSSFSLLAHLCHHATSHEIEMAPSFLGLRSLLETHPFSVHLVHVTCLANFPACYTLSLVLFACSSVYYERFLYSCIMNELIAQSLHSEP